MTDKFAQYSHPEMLVSTAWVAEHASDANLRIVESNEDLLLYDTGHVPGAVHIDWRADLNDQLVRDYLGPEDFAKLCSRHGITPETTVVFYGDKSNWWSCYALWVFHLFGHKNCKIMDGGRSKWVSEGRELTREVPKNAAVNYPVPPKRLDEEIRAFYHETVAHSAAKKPLVDVRSVKEYTGELTHMPEYPQEGVLRGRSRSRCQELPMVHCCQSRRHLQDRRGTARHLHGRPRLQARRRHHRLLPHWRALQPHVVRAHLPARLHQRPQLRRKLDGVG